MSEKRYPPPDIDWNIFKTLGEIASQRGVGIKIDWCCFHQLWQIEIYGTIKYDNLIGGYKDPQIVINKAIKYIRSINEPC